MENHIIWVPERSSREEEKQGEGSGDDRNPVEESLEDF